jgi:hypothetical protein
VQIDLTDGTSFPHEGARLHTPRTKDVYHFFADVTICRGNENHVKCSEMNWMTSFMEAGKGIARTRRTLSTYERKYSQRSGC